MYDYLLNHSGFKLRPQTVSRLLELYPDDPAMGAPFNTPNVTTWPGLGQQFKRIASLLGDYILIAPERFNVETMSRNGQPVWSYRFNMRDSTIPPEYGIPHASDIPFMFSIPTAEFTAAQNASGRFLTRSLISFVTQLDPNHVNLDRARFPHWPKYNRAPINMVFDDICHLENDTFRKDGIDFINTHLYEFVA
jgi:carboxylesterase type B